MSFLGVQFKDDVGQIIKSNREHVERWGSQNEISNEVSDVCGNKTDNSSEWISLGGPVKGSYAIKDGENEDEGNDYISDFGMRVEDPCKPFDNKQNINLNP